MHISQIMNIFVSFTTKNSTFFTTKRFTTVRKLLTTFVFVTKHCWCYFRTEIGALVFKLSEFQTILVSDTVHLKNSWIRSFQCFIYHTQSQKVVTNSVLLF